MQQISHYMSQATPLFAVIRGHRSVALVTGWHHVSGLPFGGGSWPTLAWMEGQPGAPEGTPLQFVYFLSHREAFAFAQGDENVLLEDPEGD